MNKYKHLRLENPITALWKRRREQNKQFGNTQKRIKMCASKKSFPNRNEAEQAPETKKYKNKIYECPICNRWHTTSKR